MYSFSANSLPNQPMDPILIVPRQQETNWCWAAVSLAISLHTRGAQAPFQDQCSLVSATLQSMFKLQVDCCGSGANGGDKNCNQTIDGADFSIEGGPLVLALVSPVTPALSNRSLPDIGTIVAETAAGRPICCVMDWGTGWEHAVAIVGATRDGMLLVADPGTGSLTTLDIKTFATAYPSNDLQAQGRVGQWAYAYLTT